MAVMTESTVTDQFTEAAAGDMAGLAAAGAGGAAGLGLSGSDELRRALARLTPRYQRAIDLRYLANLDHEAAAKAMGLAKPAFAVVLSRALKALRRELTRLEDDGDSNGVRRTSG